MYYIYVLKSKNHRKSYVGKTNNIEKRLEEHNKGKSVFTKSYMPWELIHKEEYETEKEAVDREKYLKSRSGRRILKEIFKEYCPVV